MTTRFRSALIAVAFAATVAGAIAGVPFRGETKEAPLVETCSHAAWPMIPAACLENGSRKDVRMIEIDRHADMPNYKLRFAVAFQ
jgi:hypothetical protein